MKKSLLITSAIIAGSLFTTTQASANTINIEATQKQTVSQPVKSVQNANSLQTQDVQLQSSTSKSSKSSYNSDTNTMNDNFEIVAFNARGTRPRNARQISNAVNSFAGYAGAALIGAAAAGAGPALIPAALAGAAAAGLYGAYMGYRR